MWPFGGENKWNIVYRTIGLIISYSISSKWRIYQHTACKEKDVKKRDRNRNRNREIKKNNKFIIKTKFKKKGTPEIQLDYYQRISIVVYS